MGTLTKPQIREKEKNNNRSFKENHDNKEWVLFRSSAHLSIQYYTHDQHVWALLCVLLFFFLAWGAGDAIGGEH